MRLPVDREENDLVVPIILRGIPVIEQIPPRLKGIAVDPELAGRVGLQVLAPVLVHPHAEPGQGGLQAVSGVPTSLVEPYGQGDARKQEGNAVVQVEEDVGPQRGADRVLV